MLKWSIFAIKDVFTVISLKQPTITNIRVASRNFSTEWLQQLSLSPDAFTFSEHQGHSSWNQTLEFGHV